MTPAIVSAQRAKIAFSVHEYQHDANATSYGLEAVEKLGLDPEKVFKTLITRVDGRLLAALVPVARQLDLKALAAVAGSKRATMAATADAERATGYQTGGISPLGQKKALPTVVDESIVNLDRVWVSAGRRGLQIELAPADLLRLCKATTGTIARQSASQGVRP